MGIVGPHLLLHRFHPHPPAAAVFWSCHYWHQKTTPAASAADAWCHRSPAVRRSSAAGAAGAAPPPPPPPGPSSCALKKPRAAEYHSLLMCMPCYCAFYVCKWTTNFTTYCMRGPRSFLWSGWLWTLPKFMERLLV